jgi:DNA-binding protein H-NS
MEIPKDKLIEVLKKEGQTEKAQQLEQELPQTIDHELHSDILEKHGVNPQEMLGKIGL